MFFVLNNLPSYFGGRFDATVVVVVVVVISVKAVQISIFLMITINVLKNYLYFSGLLSAKNVLKVTKYLDVKLEQ